MARKLEVEIVGDASSFRRAVGQADTSAGKLGKGMSGMAKAAIVAGGAAGLGAVVLGAKHAITAASNLNESTNAVRVTFGKAAPAVLDFSKHASKLGLSMREANELITPIGASLQNYGFSATDAAKQSIALTKRAADMASVFNTSVPEALEAVQAGLRGEADPLERFGVGLSDAAVKAKGVAMGFKLVDGQLSANHKTQARIKLLMEQTNKVAGDFANTSDGLANQQRILGAEFENLQAKIGAKLIPALLDVIKVMRDNWPKVVEAVQNAWTAMQPSLGKMVEAFTKIGVALRVSWTKDMKPTLDSMRSYFQTVSDAIHRNWGTIGPIVKATAQIIEAVARVIIAQLRLIAAVIRGDWSEAWRQLKTIAVQQYNAVKSYIVQQVLITKALAMLLGKAILSGVQAGLSGLVSVVKAALGAVHRAIRQVAGSVYGWAQEIGQRIVSGIISGLGSIVSAVAHKIASGVHAAIDLAKKTVGSTVEEYAAKQLGKPLSDGIAAGIKQGEMAVINALRGVLRSAISQRNFGSVSSIIQQMFAAKQAAVKTPTEKAIAGIERSRNLEDLNQGIIDAGDAVKKSQLALAEAIKSGDAQAVADAQKQLAADIRAEARAKQDLQLFYMQEKAAKERAKLDAKQLAAQIKLGATLDRLSNLFDNHKITIKDLLKAVRRILHNLHIPGYASGGRNIRAGLALVGERGPELLNLPGGSDVIPLGSGARGLPSTINLVVDGKILARAAFDPLRAEAQVFARSTGRQAFA